MGRTGKRRGKREGGNGRVCIPTIRFQLDILSCEMGCRRESCYGERASVGCAKGRSRWAVTPWQNEGERR